MPKYNKVVDLTGVGYEYTQSESIAGYTELVYYLDGKVHKTDGPARVNVWDSGTKEEYYYLNGLHIYGDGLELFKKLMNCPLSYLPKYINHKIFSAIVKERLNA